MDFFDKNINIVSNNQNGPQSPLVDAIKCIKATLEYLRIPYTCTEYQLAEKTLNLIFRSMDYTQDVYSRQTVGAPYVIYQIEQLTDYVEGKKNRLHYFSALKNATAIWECSSANMKILKEQGFSRLVHVPVGYHPLLEQVAHRKIKDIDVLLCGHITPRKAHILQKIRHCGLNAKATVALCGQPLQQLLERSKIVVSVHEPQVPAFFAEERLAFFLANRCVVVAEQRDESSSMEGLVGCDYEQLAETCVRYARKEDQERGMIAERGYEAIRKLDMATILKKALDVTAGMVVDGVHSDGEGGGYYQHARPEVLQLVPLEARKILDIGCGAGMLGRGLKARQPCDVTGLEIMPEAAASAARALDLVICGDAYVTMQGLPDNHFDAVVMADMLEHVADTDKMLQLARCKLGENGKLILSIPNTRHWSVIRSLLEGLWEYEDAGILDKTHVRFFTLTSILRRLKTNGFEVEQSLATSFGDGAPRGFVEAIGAFGLNVGDLEADSNRYQYLLVCGKSPA